METDKIILEVVTPYRQVLSEEVDEVIAPGEEGQFGILPGHTPFLAKIRIGDLLYRKDNQIFHLAVSNGYSEASYHKVIAMLDAAERPSEIDIQRAEKALKRAEEKLAVLSPEDKAFFEERTALERALNRIHIAKVK
ncbi:MAG: F0F1 ATP synthase subunit epsilon [Deltaproteobacteria bacterium]|nr:F0F1 ATP synthase subunit epsilon [Candidatus Anaeroferrophillus wilburensis]MBN2889088.1 F0F1 ATP synthase subunit epsilon [Deltaproteobacteria bacterium]